MKISYLSFIIMFLNACGDLLNDYESNPLDPMKIDQEMCRILNELETIDANTVQNNLLTINALFDSLVQDTASFIHLSNINNWNIPIDSSCYFMLFAPQEADSYFVVLNSYSELQLYGQNGNLINADNSTTSLRSIAGCPEVRTRQTFSQLTGVYLAKLVNPNVSSVKMVVMNTNNLPSANFSTSANDVFVGDTIAFVDESSEGSYPILTYGWNFGDNSINNDSSVVEHAYADSGEYSPSLTVSDGYLFHTLVKNAHIRVDSGGNE